MKFPRIIRLSLFLAILTTAPVAFAQAAVDQANEAREKTLLGHVSVADGFKATLFAAPPNCATESVATSDGAVGVERSRTSTVPSAPFTTKTRFETSSYAVTSAAVAPPAC